MGLYPLFTDDGSDLFHATSAPLHGYKRFITNTSLLSRSSCPICDYSSSMKLPKQQVLNHSIKKLLQSSTEKLRHRKELECVVYSQFSMDILPHLLYILYYIYQTFFSMNKQDTLQNIMSFFYMISCRFWVVIYEKIYYTNNEISHRPRGQP